MTSRAHVILHHYPQSPVAEKIRIVLGMKGLTWKSVLIPRLPPKPNLTPLTGGYRLTPVMQIGSDIYCDTKCIIHELERRFPHPTRFLNKVEGSPWGIDQWIDIPLFQDVVTVALVDMSPNMPPEFLADRGPLYFGQDFSLEAIKSKYTQCLDNISKQLGLMDERLKSRDFMLGQEASLPDALAYYLVWFLRDRISEAEQFLGQFENLMDWEQRVKSIGHGNPQEMSDLAALYIAKNTTPQTPEHADPDDPLGLRVGDRVFIEPITGGPQVVGTLHNLSPDRIAISRESEQAKQVCIHFPRIGYRAALLT